MLLGEGGVVSSVKLLIAVLSPGTGKLTSEDARSVAAELGIPSGSGACLGEDGAVATVG